MTLGYCVKCKNKVEILEPIESVTKRNVKITKGKCGTCGTKVCRLGKNE